MTNITLLCVFQSSDFAARLNTRYYYNIDNGSLFSDESGNRELAVAELVLTCNMMNTENTPNDRLTNIDNGSVLSDESGNHELSVAHLFRFRHAI